MMKTLIFTFYYTLLYEHALMLLGSFVFLAT